MDFKYKLTITREHKQNIVLKCINYEIEHGIIYITIEKSHFIILPMDDIDMIEVFDLNSFLF